MTSLRRKLILAAIGICAVALAGLHTVALAEGKPATDLPVKVYLMAGQSNMVGHASAKYIQENHRELTKPRPDVWCVGIGKVSGPLQPGYGGGAEIKLGK